MKNIFSVKTYLNSCLLPMETSNFGKTILLCQYDETSYNGPSETNSWIFTHFLHQSIAPFSSPFGSIFFFLFDALYSH